MALQQLKQNAYTSIYDTVSQTKQFMNEKLSEIATNITILDNDSDLNSLLNRSDDSAFELEPLDYVSLNKSLEKVFIHRNGVMDSILVFYNNGKIAFQKNEEVINNTTLPLEYYISRIDEDKNLSSNHWLMQTDYNQDNGHQGYVSAFKLLGKKRDFIKGVLLFQIRPSYFKTILGNPTISQNGYLCLISKDGVMRFKDIDPKYELIDNELKNTILDGHQTQGKTSIMNSSGNQMLVIYDTLSINKWIIAAVVPENELYHKVDYMKYINLAMMFILIIIAIFLANLLANVITKPIIHLTRKINNIEQGNFEITFSDKQNIKEIDVLNRGIRDMIHRISDLIVKLETEQEKKRLAELTALQYQIQPHFLYNTLFSIKQLCEMGETKKAGSMVLALSNFFRISISKGSEIIPISQEIKHIENYLQIQESRYGDKFNYRIDIPEEMLNYKILKLTLQPLIENSLYHGIKQKNEKGTIYVRGIEMEDDCYIWVEDNGAGMSPEKLMELNSSIHEDNVIENPVGFGVGNVHKRLQLHFGNNYGLFYESEEGLGTVVTVKIKRIQ
ncbi:sensor histidine kinase [Paenibacillus filicis]|uniref:Sensor histidine kinase n=1 Tax=Paenibacillus gyeongsangnamensis TaxID=3388067 RepID=A0ABT4QBM1_9BACL|nr:sensor histidine kinase [Paenibacillus filicis]MCZ8514287.1 sensor histidine kinase [Paenibacillus filicis]